jgi:hypothetical protein
MQELIQKFRIKENEIGFTIQREFFHKEKSPKKWYEKQKFSISKGFENIGVNGERINFPFGENPPHPVLKTLKEAKDKIALLTKFPIYHYCSSDFPEFPVDRPSV